MKNLAARPSNSSRVRQWQLELSDTLTCCEMQVHVQFPRLILIGQPDGSHECRHGVQVEQMADERTKLHERTGIRCGPLFGVALPSFRRTSPFARRHGRSAMHIVGRCCHDL